MEKSFQNAIELVNSIDLTRVGRKLIEREGWSKRKVNKTKDLYRKFLVTAKLNPNVEVVPNYEVDEMWHNHVLDMKNYENDSISVFGSIFYHTPTFGERDLRPEFERTNTLMINLFGVKMKAPKNFSPTSCGGDCCGGCGE